VGLWQVLFRISDLALRIFMSNRGFTLLETLIATAIILAGVGAIFALGAASFLAAKSSSEHFTAAYLAQEGIEVVRGLRDNNWLTDNPWTQGFSNNTDYIVQFNDQSLRLFADTPLLKDANGFFRYDSGTPTQFKRKISISNLTSDSFQVTSTVTWSEKTVEVSDVLWNWK
jgi:Tfp pilus assembly protein PilV